MKYILLLIFSICPAIIIIIIIIIIITIPGAEGQNVPTDLWSHVQLSADIGER